MDNYEKLFGNKQTIMVVTAHPDDLDVMCGGTVARLISDGKRVISIKTTTGNNGSRDKVISQDFLAKKRQSEDAAAMKKLGIKTGDSISLGLDDGSIENNKELIERISFYIRKFQPEIIITLNPDSTVISKGDKKWLNHRDHRNTAAATADAIYPFSRDRSFFSSQFEDPSIKPSRCNEILFADYATSGELLKVRIDAFIPQKQEALECHASQFSKSEAQKVLELYSTTDASGTFETFSYVNFG